MTELTLSASHGRSITTVEDLSFDSLGYFVRRSRSVATLKAYESDLKHFKSWLIEQGIRMFPSQIDQAVLLLNDYFMSQSHLAPSTLNGRRSAISFLYTRLELADPTKTPRFDDCFTGIINERFNPSGDAVPYIVRPPSVFACVEEVRAFIDAIDTRTLSGIRDRAMFLYALFGACRQSEVTNLRHEQIDDHFDYFVVSYNRSKTNQRGKNQFKVVPKSNQDDSLCPYSALASWLKASGIDNGPVFRGFYRSGGMREEPLSHVTYNRLIKRYAARAQLKEPERFSGHTFRATFDGWAVEAGTDFQLRRQQTWHETQRSENPYPRGINITDHHVAFKVLDHVHRPQG